MIPILTNAYFSKFGWLKPPNQFHGNGRFVPREEGKMNHFSVAQLLLQKRAPLDRADWKGGDRWTTWIGVWEKIREIFNTN